MSRDLQQPLNIRANLIKNFDNRYKYFELIENLRKLYLDIVEHEDFGRHRRKRKASEGVIVYLSYIELLFRDLKKIVEGDNPDENDGKYKGKKDTFDILKWLQKQVEAFGANFSSVTRIFEECVSQGGWNNKQKDQADEYIHNINNAMTDLIATIKRVKEALENQLDDIELEITPGNESALEYNDFENFEQEIFKIKAKGEDGVYYLQFFLFVEEDIKLNIARGTIVTDSSGAQRLNKQIVTGRKIARGTRFALILTEIEAGKEKEIHLGDVINENRGGKLQSGLKEIILTPLIQSYTREARNEYVLHELLDDSDSPFGKFKLQIIAGKSRGETSGGEVYEVKVGDPSTIGGSSGSAEKDAYEKFNKYHDKLMAFIDKQRVKVAGTSDAIKAFKIYKRMHVKAGSNLANHTQAFIDFKKHWSKGAGSEITEEQAEDLENKFTQYGRSLVGVAKYFGGKKITSELKSLSDTPLLNNIRVVKESFENLPDIYKSGASQWQQIIDGYQGFLTNLDAFDPSKEGLADIDTKLGELQASNVSYKNLVDQLESNIASIPTGNDLKNYIVQAENVHNSVGKLLNELFSIEGDIEDTKKPTINEEITKWFVQTQRLFKVYKSIIERFKHYKSVMRTTLDSHSYGCHKLISYKTEVLPGLVPSIPEEFANASVDLRNGVLTAILELISLLEATSDTIVNVISEINDLSIKLNQYKTAHDGIINSVPPSYINTDVLNLAKDVHSKIKELHDKAVGKELGSSEANPSLANCEGFLDQLSIYYYTIYDKIIKAGSLSVDDKDLIKQLLLAQDLDVVKSLILNTNIDNGKRGNIDNIEYQQQQILNVTNDPGVHAFTNQSEFDNAFSNFMTLVDTFASSTIDEKHVVHINTFLKDATITTIINRIEATLIKGTVSLPAGDQINRYVQQKEKLFAKIQELLDGYSMHKDETIARGDVVSQIGKLIDFKLKDKLTDIGASDASVKLYAQIETIIRDVLKKLSDMKVGEKKSTTDPDVFTNQSEFDNTIRTTVLAIAEFIRRTDLETNPLLKVNQFFTSSNIVQVFTKIQATLLAGSLTNPNEKNLASYYGHKYYLFKKIEELFTYYKYASEEASSRTQLDNALDQMPDALTTDQLTTIGCNDRTKAVYRNIEGHLRRILRKLNEMKPVDDGKTLPNAYTNQEEFDKILQDVKNYMNSFASRDLTENEVNLVAASLKEHKIVEILNAIDATIVSQKIKPKSIDVLSGYLVSKWMYFENIYKRFESHTIKDEELSDRNVAIDALNELNDSGLLDVLEGYSIDEKTLSDATMQTQRGLPNTIKKIIQLLVDMGKKGDTSSTGTEGLTTDFTYDPNAPIPTDRRRRPPTGDTLDPNDDTGESDPIDDQESEKSIEEIIEDTRGIVKILKDEYPWLRQLNADLIQHYTVFREARTYQYNAVENPKDIERFVRDAKKRSTKITGLIGRKQKKLLDVYNRVLGNTNAVSFQRFLDHIISASYKVTKTEDLRMLKEFRGDIEAFKQKVLTIETQVKQFVSEINIANVQTSGHLSLGSLLSLQESVHNELKNFKPEFSGNNFVQSTAEIKRLIKGQAILLYSIVEYTSLIVQYYRRLGRLLQKYRPRFDAYERNRINEANKASLRRAAGIQENQ